MPDSNCVREFVRSRHNLTLVDRGELSSISPSGGRTMKRISLFAAAALLFAGAQLHAQATQDTTKKAGKAATKMEAKPAGKAAEKPAAEKPAAMAKAATKADTAAATTKKASKKKSKKAAMAKDSTAKKP